MLEYSLVASNHQSDDGTQHACNLAIYTRQSDTSALATVARVTKHGTTISSSNCLLELASGGAPCLDCVQPQGQAPLQAVLPVQGVYTPVVEAVPSTRLVYGNAKVS